MKPLRSFCITESNSSVSRQSKTLLCYRDTVSTAKMFGSRRQMMEEICEHDKKYK